MSDGFSGRILNPAQAAIVPRAPVGTKHGEHIPQLHEDGGNEGKKENLTLLQWVKPPLITMYIKSALKSGLIPKDFFHFWSISSVFPLVAMLVAGWI